MIALVAAGRGGGGGTPAVITVPWFPSVEERGELPGYVHRALMKVVDATRRHGITRSFLELSDSALFLELHAVGFPFHRALAMVASRNLMMELGLLQQQAVRP
jgi:hypothetical protein